MSCTLIPSAAVSVVLTTGVSLAMPETSDDMVLLIRSSSVSLVRFVARLSLSVVVLLVLFVTPSASTLAAPIVLLCPNIDSI
jgi:hypothetical protein